MIRSLLPLALGAVVASGSATFGQCAVIDFEQFAPGSVATNLIPGVTITSTNGACGGGLPLIEITSLTGGPEGTTKVIVPRQGCPEFSPEGILLTFAEDHDRVRFRTGVDAPGQNIRVRWFNEFGTTLGTRTYGSATGVGLLVTIETTAAIIRSVEIKHVGDFFEMVDDLEFENDTTPPTVEIDSPAFDECVCGDSIVSIVGTVADDDGTYECDRAEYRPINADPGVPWTQIGQACGAFSGTLHSWNTTGIPAGRYYLRVTGENACGLSQSDVTVVRVDREFGTLQLTPITEPLCGTPTIEGRVRDACGVSWTLDQRPAGGGAWVTIATGDSGEDCEIADWDTTAVADGDYTLRLRGTDGCGHTATTTLNVTVDNSNGCGCTADLNGDGVVNFSDLLLLLSVWTP